LVNALWITLIGMGLVFVAILLLWGLMVLLVRLTAEKPLPLGPKEGGESAAIPATAENLVEHALGEPDLHALHQRAALAAAAAALALNAQRKERTRADSLPAGGISPWQSANRAAQLNGRAGLARKKVMR
jgi:hypothetical protein